MDSGLGWQVDAGKGRRDALVFPLGCFAAGADEGGQG
jgi:hypothetical protein